MRKTIATQEETQKPVDSSTTRETSPLAGSGFPIAGIGASAGGLEALVMEVAQVRDRMTVQPDCVYVIPPNKDMSIRHGVLHLLPPGAPRGLRLPVDFFLRSLAADCQERAIGVILSGMGSDGTMGLRAIREKAGLVLVQDPASAKFDSMPRSAIDAGLADTVAPAEQLPGKIADHLRRTLLPEPEPIPGSREQSALEKILISLRAKTGHDFSLYKKSTVYRRIERRMGIHQIDKIDIYARYLQENPQEAELLFGELLIGVTNFFRDPTAWQRLRDEVIPAILAEFPAGGVLRAWSAGCATGEEAYSLAMVFKEALERVRPQGIFTLHIFATDLDPASIKRARAGRYPANIRSEVSAERLRRFFIEGENCYRVGKEIREMITFATQNVIMDPPFTKLDLLICRNLLIYLVPELQKKLLPLFHYSLNPGGALFLGSAETIGGLGDLFLPLHPKSRLYRRGASPPAREPVAFPSSFLAPHPSPERETIMEKPPVNLQSLADQLLLRNFTPPAVLVNDKGDIVYISGHTGKFLEPACGRANWNIFAMAREGLRFEVYSAFQKASQQKGQVTVKGAKMGTDGGSQAVEVSARAFTEPEALRGMVMIVFNEVATVHSAKSAASAGKTTSGTRARIVELEQELLQRREETRSTREEMQSSQEELKSMNEELQSTNEELQSSNEELTTSKEEMQSMNEELQSVNAEQQARVDELSRLSSDMKNLLNSTEIATVFLHNDFKLRRFTTDVGKLFRLIPGDVGRPLTDIASDLDYPDMLDDAREVLRTLVFSEKQVSASRGRWFSVRIMAYRTLENVIDGVVITFSDITDTKTLEAKLQERGEETRSMLDGMVHGFASFEVVADDSGDPRDYRFLSVNPAFERLFGLPGLELVGKSASGALPGFQPALLDACRSVALSGEPVFFTTRQGGTDDYEITVYRPALGRLACMFANLTQRRQSP